MAVDKDKVLAAIELKFKGKSITKTFKENLAAKWADKIETDEDIDTYIEDREDIISEAISEADRRATDAVKKASEKAKHPKTDNHGEKEVELPEDTPAWAKALIEQNKALEAKVTGFEKSQTQKTITERFKTDSRLKNIPEFMFKGRIPQTEDEFENAVTELSTDYETWAKENNLQKFGHDKPGGSAGGKTDGKVSDIVKEFAEKTNKEVVK